MRCDILPDDDKGPLSRPHAARKDVPVERQDTLRVRVRARFPARGRQTHQVHLMCASRSYPSKTTLFVLFDSGAHASCGSTASNPPPRDLKVSDPAVRDLTLTELELAPSSVLHLRFLDDALNRTSSFFPPLPPLFWWGRWPSPPLRPCFPPSRAHWNPPPKQSGLIWLIHF